VLIQDGTDSKDELDVKSRISMVSLFGICFAAVIADNVPAGSVGDEVGSEIMSVDANLDIEVNLDVVR